MTNLTKELCIKIYQAKDWIPHNREKAIYGDLVPKKIDFEVVGYERPILGYEYDLEYILEKLPKREPEWEGGLKLQYIVRNKEWLASYNKGRRARADTPLQAALSLTLNLIEAEVI